MSADERLVEVASPDAPAAIGPYAQAVRVGELVFCSGQIGLDPKTGDLVEGGVRAESERVLQNLAAVLEAAGSSLEAVVKVTIYLTTMDDFAALNEIYADHFGDARPSRATVAVKALPRGACVEMDAIALAGASSA